MPLTPNQAVDLMPEFITSCKYFHVEPPQMTEGYWNTCKLQNKKFNDGRIGVMQIASCQNCPLDKGEK